MMEKRHVVLNRIKSIDLTMVSVKKWAVIKLLNWQPDAVGIRFMGRCHCKGRYLMSYRLPLTDTRPPFEGYEQCGYFCPTCGFGNAGSREIWQRHFGRKVE